MAGDPNQPAIRSERLLAVRELRRLWRRGLALVALVFALLLLGAAAYATAEGVGFWFGLRWSLDTAATEGGFPQPRSTAGQIVQVGLIVLGVGTFFYALATVAELFANDQLSRYLSLRRSERKVNALSNHHIICGFGRVGRQVARTLGAAHVPFVVVDPDPENRARAQAAEIPCIQGDASDDAVLIEAGIKRARSVVVCSDSDANNVFITLTARGLREDIPIIARAAVEDSERKLIRAGANRVISPYKSSGTEMARLALQQQLSGVVEVDPHFRLEEIEVGSRCGAAGKRLEEVQGKALVLAVRKGNRLILQPPGNTPLAAGDLVVAVGPPKALTRLEEALEEPAPERSASDGGKAERSPS